MISRFPSYFVSLVFIFLVGAQAQDRPTSTQVPGRMITRPESIQDSNLYDYWAQMSRQGRAGGALLGKVAVEGEPLPWQPLLVTVNCDGKIVYTTQSDAKGNFGIYKIQLPGALGKQGDSQRQMETHFENCLVQGSVPGFHSTSITITHNMLRDQPEIGTIVLSRSASDAATAVSRTTETASPKALKAFEKARAQMIERDTDGAARELQKAVQADPHFAEAWLELGKLQLVADPQSARESFSKALAADPNFVLPNEQLAVLSAQGGEWQEVLDRTNKISQVYPEGTALSWYLNALANYQLHARDAAEASARKSLALDPAHTIMNTEQLLAVILAAKGDFPGALQCLRSSLSYVPPGPNSDLLKQQIAQLEKRSANK